MNYLLGILAPLFLTSPPAFDVESCDCWYLRRTRAVFRTWDGLLCVSEQGTFLTCYHVIAGADRITVYNGTDRFEDIIIDQVGP